MVRRNDILRFGIHVSIKQRFTHERRYLDLKCTRIRAIHYQGGYVEELSCPGDRWTYEEPRELYYDAPTATTVPADYKPNDYNKYFNETIKAYEGSLCVDEKLANSVSESLRPKPDGCNYTVKEVKGTIKKFKFKKNLVNSIVRKLNEDACYKELHYAKRKYTYFSSTMNSDSRATRS